MVTKACWTSDHDRLFLPNLAVCLVILVAQAACRPSPTVQQAVPPTVQVSSEVPVSGADRLNPTLAQQVASPDQNPAAIPAQPVLSIPPTWDILKDDFANNSFDPFGQVGESGLNLVKGSGQGGSTALAIALNKRESYIYKTTLKKSAEGYLTFWFNPNGVAIPDPADEKVPHKSIRVADIKGSGHYTVLAGLRIYKPGDQGYKAYLEWEAVDGNHFDNESGEFDLTDGWQKITLGYRVNNWVAVWRDGVLARQVKGINHVDPFADIVELGKANDDASIIPSGVLRYDQVVYQIPSIRDLWVDAENGNDGNDGLSQAAAFRTIQKAASLAGPGTTVHILPGVYRETISPALDGSPSDRVLYRAENGRGTVVVRGSESSKTLAWTQMQSNSIGLPSGVDPADIYVADLSAWKLSAPPRFLVELDSSGNVAARLPLAREPDWPVKTEWKYHEFWWSADGGSNVANCNPATDPDPNCDTASRSMTQLTDRTSDSEPAGIEPGNLTTLGNLTGATLVAIDTLQGHYVYRRKIIAHDVSAGRITVDRKCEHDDGSDIPGLGWGTKYYVEGKPSLLDTPGEWWYDQDSGRLYLWPPSPENPANLNIEISRLEDGFHFSERSFVTLDGITLEFFNGSAIEEYNDPGSQSYDNTVRNVTLRYSNHGVYFRQAVDDSPDHITRGFTMEQSEIAYMDTDAISLAYTWKNESAPDSFTHAGITGTLIQGNELHHLGFRTDRDNAVGVTFERADNLRFVQNHVHHVAHNGVQFSWSIIHSAKKYAFAADEIKTGEILIQDNLFEQACQLTTDCGALKFWGDPPDGHVYRDVLITGNIFRNTYGWTYVSEKRHRWTGGPGSEVRGMGGYGLYIDMASGITAYRNISANNGFAGFMIGGVWRDGDILLYNNVAANSLYGFFISGLEFDTHPNVNTQIVNNILVNNEAQGIWFTDKGGPSNEARIDRNLYFNNGWRSYENGGVWKAGAFILRNGQDTYTQYPTLADIQTKTPWEAHGQEGDPGFVSFNPDDHSRAGPWPDFHITGNSQRVLNMGTTELPDILSRLLILFGVSDSRLGSAFDIGRYEAPGTVVNPPVRYISPAGVGQFSLKAYPGDLSGPVTLTASTASINLSLDLTPTVLNPGTEGILTVTDHHPPTQLPSFYFWSPISITASYAGAEQITKVMVVVGNIPQFMPLTIMDTQ